MPPADKGYLSFSALINDAERFTSPFEYIIISITHDTS